MAVDFEWPCDRSVAHGPHEVEVPMLAGEPPEVFECPGVPAHPATMAGGSDIKIRKQVDAR